MESINNNNHHAPTSVGPLPSPDAVLPSVAAELGVKQQPPNAFVPGDGVRVLTLAEYKQAGLTLAEAFKEDHTSTYFTHTPDRSDWTAEQKWDLHVKIMEYITYAHLLKGLVVAAGPEMDCVGLW